MMDQPNQKIVALVMVDADRGPLGFAAAHNEPFAGATVIECTLRRLAACRELDGIVVAHRADQTPPDVSAVDDERVTLHAIDGPIYDDLHAQRIAGRKWSPTGWRGGLGGATVYDELLTPGPMLQVMDAVEATAALLVGADWPMVDPQLCDAVIERHRRQPDVLKLVFTQAPPGLAGCVIGRDLMGQLDRDRVSIGTLLEYQPRLPQADPIAKDPCVLIQPVVRNAMLRGTFDAPRWQRLLHSAHPDMDAATLVRTLTDELHANPTVLPQQVTVELQTERPVDGPIVPQHHVDLQRQPMTLDAAQRLFEQLAVEPDVTVTLGGLGDALAHPQFESIVEAAHAAGIWGIAVETDLLVDHDAIQRLVELPIDVVSVRLNADSPATYEQLMGRDAFKQVVGNIETLFKLRSASSRPGLPWIVPRMVKTKQNVAELEKFFDRWMYVCSHALIEPPTTGCGLVEDQAVLDMSPPLRFPCRQLDRRMTVHADGRVPLCDQDWQCRAQVGDVDEQDIAAIWRSMDQPRRAHQAGKYEELTLCGGCREWHRP